MNTSEVLNRAADLIEERGWATGNCGMLADPTAPMCLEGALSVAMGIKAEPSRGTHEIPAGTPVYPYGRRLEGSPSYAALLTYLDRRAELWVWNDCFARDADSVIEVLRACAVIEASREREAAEVSA